MPGRYSYRSPAVALAGALAWAAVGLELWSGPLVATVVGAALPVHGLARMLHAVFAVLFVVSLTAVQRRWLRLVMATALCVIALVLVALYRYNSAAALLIIPMLEFAGLLGARALLAVFLASNLMLLWVVVAFRQMDGPLTYVGLHASLQLFAILLVKSTRRTERARDALANVNAELVATRGVLSEVARGQERLRLSRELHDVAGHKLTALRLNLSALTHNKALDADEVIAQCTRLTEELLDDLRSVVHQLRLHDGLDLGAVMDRIAAPFPRPRVHLQIASDARASTPEQAEALLRIFQEGLTNAAKHSNAGQLWVTLSRQHDEMTLDLRDDGRGRGDVSAGNGLTGMRERLKSLGGRLEFGRIDDGGFRLRATLPDRC